MRTFGDEHAARRSTAIAHPGAYIAKVQPPLAKYNPGRYVDGWAHNPYWGTKSPFASAFKAPSVGIGNMKDLFRQLDRSPGDAPKGGVGPGVRVRDDAGRAQQRREPANQANYLADAMGIAAETNRVPLFIWYVMTDPSEAADRQSGLLTATGAAKPSYFMYQRPVSPGTSVASKAGR